MASPSRGDGSQQFAIWIGAATFRFGSSHSGGFNMAFCDGSVHSIIYEIDTRVHLELADRQDGVPIEASTYLGQ